MSGSIDYVAGLIAMDKVVETDNKLIYGAITLGDFWRFGMLNRESKNIIKDIDSYSIPSDTENVFRILLGIAESTN